MAFEPMTRCDGKEMELMGTNATTFVKNKLVKYSSGYLTNAAAGDNVVEYLCLESKTTTATGELVKVIPVDQTIVFRALCSTTPVQATHVGNNYDLADDATVDLAATTDVVFHIDRIVDATNKIVEGRFLTRE